MPSNRIALMGFGRIGRNLFRILYRSDDIEVAAIADPADPKALEYLLRYDTLHGRFPDEASILEGNLYTRGRQIPVLSETQAGRAPWAELGIDVVIEATGRPRDRQEMERHLDWGAKRVILCVPPLDPPDITLVRGVNDDQLKPEHRIVSNSSCTAHCAGPVVRILDRAFGIRRAFLSTVHAYTNEQRLADVPTADPRRGRAAAENIIPQTTDSAELIMKLLPGLRGKLTGKSMNVPVANGSVVDLVCWHDKPVTVTAVNEVVRTAALADYREVLEYEDNPIVSSDIIRNTCSGTFDSDATMVLGDRMSKTLTWFDNGWGYAHRVVDLIHRFAELDKEAA